jgi:ATP-dependent helicase HrpA
MAARVREAIAQSSPLAEQTGLRAWPGGAVPRTVEASHAGAAVTGYPTLVDEGDSVALRVLPSAAEQRSAMWAGTRRLLLLQLGSPLRVLDRSLRNATKLALAGTDRISAADAYRECSVAALDHLLLEAGGPVWDEAAFDALLASVRADFAATATRAATVVGDIAAVVASIDARLGSMLAASLDDTVVDVRAHLSRLLHAGWISAAGVDRLPDVARYVRAIEHRLGKAVASPDRDRAHLRAVRALEREYAEIAHRDRDGAVRWMLEELRVATFAQSIGAKPGTSEQKARKALSALV